MKGYNRTPPGSTSVQDTPLPEGRYSVSCAADGTMTITIRGNYPNEPAIYAGESLMFSVEADLKPDFTDYSRYTNAAVMPDGEKVEGVVIRDSAGGDGVGGQSVTVGDYVWVDENKDGLQTDGEPGIPGVVLELVDENGTPVTKDYSDQPFDPLTTTGPNGEYVFTGMAPGHTYTVRIVQDDPSTVTALAPYEPTVANAGDRAVDSSMWTSTSRLLPYAGERDMTLDFGFVVKTPPTTETPTDTPTTDVPTDTPTTDVPTDTPTTDVPTDTPTTDVPTDTPTTDVPTDTPTTDVPTDTPTTDVPTDTPTTDVPTDNPTTDVPTDNPTTDTPSTTAPSTSVPSDSPTTSAPSTPAPSNPSAGPVPNQSGGNPPASTRTGSSSLAKTGTDARVLLVGALALVAAGAALLRVRQRTE